LIQKQKWSITNAQNFFKVEKKIFRFHEIIVSI
jgi:hypothetical protein